MSSDKSRPDSTEPSTAEPSTAVHRMEDLLAQLEGHGYKRNGHDDLLRRAADAETYYGEAHTGCLGRCSVDGVELCSAWGGRDGRATGLKDARRMHHILSPPPAGWTACATRTAQQQSHASHTTQAQQEPEL